MGNKTLKLILLFLIISGFYFSFLTARAEEADEGRKLELEYPAVSGLKPETIETGLPEYVKYIFYFSIGIIGFIIFGALVYSGIQYLTSAGQPAKLAEAKKGIASAFLGAIILVSAVLIFKTINPSLVELELAEVPLIHAPLMPGVYVCNYNYSGVDQDIKDYLYGDLEKRIEAIRRIKEALGTLGTGEYCKEVRSSQNLDKLAIKAENTDNTIFILPERNVEEEGCRLNEPDSLSEDCWIWEYGAILQEDPDPIPGGKRCLLLSEPINMKVYHPLLEYHLNLSFNANSIVVFKKPSKSISGLTRGVTLYEGKAYNKIGRMENKEEKKNVFNFAPLWEPFKVFAQAIDPELGTASFKPDGDYDVKMVFHDELKNIPAKNSDPDKGIEGLHHNTRSIEFENNTDLLFAVLLGRHEDYTGKGKIYGDEEFRVCEVRTKSDEDLMASPIGRCGRCAGIFRFLKLADCYPCLEKLYVIKGTIMVGK